MDLTYEVYHGDCFDRLAEIPDKSVTLILTDPPYGHNNKNGDLLANLTAAMPNETAKRAALGRKTDFEFSRETIHNDGEDANELVRRLFAEAARVLNPVGCCCCCCSGGGGPDPSFARWSLWMDEVMSFVQMVIWDRGRGGLGWRYRRCYEVMLIAVPKRGKLPWYDHSGSIWNVIRPGDHGIRPMSPPTREHPTQKPVELFEHFIRLHTKPGDLVVDPFCGSGSSGVAAKRLGRSWLGCDTDERWVEMTRRRLAATTSPLPEMLEDELEECRELEKEQKTLLD